MPSVDRLIQLAQYFNVSTDYLLGLSEQRPLSAGQISEEVVGDLQAIVDSIISFTYKVKEEE